MASRRRNIVLITTDQQRFDTVGQAAPSFLRTPHLDHLAREGVTFTHAYAECPVCIPARTTIMTGLHAYHHGMINNGRLPDGSLPIDRATSLPARMRALGYQTAAIGKMHFQPMRARYGFEEMILPDDYYEEMARTPGVGQPMQHGLGQNELYPSMATVPESYTLTAWIVDQCVRYIKRRRDPQLPFFLWCSFSKPHPPLDPPEPYYSMYRDAPIPEPWVGAWAEGPDCPEAFRRFRESWSLDLVPPEILRAARAAYYGLITQIDYNLGRLFAALQDLDLFNDTVILFASDHGEMLGDHRSGAKGFMFEGSAHIPMILRLPPTWEGRPVGVALDGPVCLADVLATCVSAAGGAPVQDTDGHDLIALATGQLERPREWVEVTLGLPSTAYHGITDGRWKYVHYVADGKEQLFDLRADPHELINLAPDGGHRSALEACRSVLVERLSRRGSPLVRDGKLAVVPLPPEPEAARRARPWPGYHTSTYPEDVRH